MGKSGAEAVFVYATKSQRATRQSQRLRLCRAIKSRRSRATKIARKNRRCDSGLTQKAATKLLHRLVVHLRLSRFFARPHIFSSTFSLCNL